MIRYPSKPYVVTVIAGLVLASLACKPIASPNNTTSVSSSRKITFVSFPDSGPALILEYETEIDPVKEKSLLRKEVDGVWPDLRTQLEAKGYKSGAVRAIKYARSGVFLNGNGYTFVFKQNEHGEWYCLDDQVFNLN